MTYVIWLLRIIHIGAGVFWVGSSLTMMFFVGPTVGATGDAGQKFLGYLMNNRKISARISAAAGASVLAGAILYWIDSQGFTSAWVKSGAGTGFTIGALFAIVGFVFGIFVGRTNKALAQLGAQIQGKPSAEQTIQLQTIRKQQATYSTLSAIGLILAVVFMSVARYLHF
jgi:uncharacterized membrane protein